MRYNENNIFAKIIRNSELADVVYENDYVLCFKDIQPLAPVHVLLIPKGQYISIQDFSENATDLEIIEFNRAISHVTKILGISDSYNLKFNSGKGAGQEVMHCHAHITSNVLIE